MYDSQQPEPPSGVGAAPMTLALLALLVVALVDVESAAAASQSVDQQRCIVEMNKRAGKLAREQGKTNRACVKAAARGDVDKLGIPPQEQTALACLTNDVRGKLAKRMGQLTEADGSRCLELPQQLPDYAYTGAAATNAAVQSSALTLMNVLFGGTDDLGIVSDGIDRNGSRCQQEAVKRAHRIIDDLWKQGRKQTQAALAGKNRHLGNDAKAPTLTDLELRDELTTYLLDDPKGKIAKATGKLSEKLQAACASASTPIATLFAGDCASSSDLAALSDCTIGQAIGLYFTGLDGADALGVDCDVLDDGSLNASCVSDDLKRHVLGRIGYGPDPWSMNRIDEIGLSGYILEQLDPATIDDSALDVLLVQFPSLSMSFNDLRLNYVKGGDPSRNVVRQELQEAKFLRAVASRRQLEQVLFDFWFNHFNVDARSSSRTKWDISPYDRVAVRAHVLATFFDLVLANARSPAMGDYLDNRRSKVDKINENYARELMELHTIGVDGGFDENDVVEVARALTGWRENYDIEPDGFEFESSWHDDGPKNLFGGALILPGGGGEQDGIDVLTYLASQPATADFICRKLVRRFVNEALPEDLVSAAAAEFLSSGGDIPSVMETILLSDEFLLELRNRGNKVKRPHVLLASVARALGADPSQIDWRDLRKDSAAMGEANYESPPPIGYPDSSGFWASPGTLVTRFNEIERRARGKDGFSFTYPIAGGTSAEIVDALSGMLLPGTVSSDTRTNASAMLDLLPVTDAEKIEQAAAFLMSSPEFLQH